MAQQEHTSQGLFFEDCDHNHLVDPHDDDDDNESYHPGDDLMMMVVITMGVAWRYAFLPYRPYMVAGH